MGFVSKLWKCGGKDLSLFQPVVWGFCYLLDLKLEDRDEAAGTGSILLNAGLPLFALAQSLAPSFAQSKRQ